MKIIALVVLTHILKSNGLPKEVENMSNGKLVSKAVMLGIAGALGLALFYLGLVSLFSRSISHAFELLQVDRFYVGAVALGFGVQLGMHNLHKSLLKQCKDKASTAATVAGTGTSTASMVACCVHHVADFAPLIAGSGVAIFFNDYKYQLMTMGIIVNLIGIAISVNALRKHYKAHLAPSS